MPGKKKTTAGAAFKAAEKQAAAEKRNDPKANGMIVIQPLKSRTARFLIEGIVPYVQQCFTEKAKAQIRETQMAGSQSRKGKKREPKDFDALYRAAMHKSTEGWIGIPAGAFRSAMISACRLVGFKMTIAKLSIWVDGDGIDAIEGTPLVRITKGDPRPVEHHAPNTSGGIDLRCRPMWREGWQAIVRASWDDLARVGLQVGVGEGRPDSKRSAGMGWGRFRVVSVS
jgi:hypothetical protein